MYEMPSVYKNLETKSTEWILEEYRQAVEVARNQLSTRLSLRSGDVLHAAENNAVILAMELEKRGIWVDPRQDFGPDLF